MMSTSTDARNQFEARKFVEASFVPNGMHRADAAVWKARYPGVKVYAPAAVRAAVEKVVAVDTTVEDAGGALGAAVVAPDGIKRSEYIYAVRGAWVLADVMMNLPKLGGLDGWLATTAAPAPARPSADADAPPRRPARPVGARRRARVTTSRSSTAWPVSSRTPEHSRARPRSGCGSAACASTRPAGARSSRSIS